MGKGRNKNKDKEALAAGPPRTRASRAGNYSDSDCESVSTHITLDDDMRSVQGQDEADDAFGTTIIDGLCEHMDNATNKNISVRLAALRHLHLGLTSNYLGDELTKYKATLIDLATRAIKKGEEECVVGSQLLAVVAVQLGEEVAAEVAEPLSLLNAIVTDAARVLVVRSMAALSIGITAYFACDREDLMTACAKALGDTWNSFKVGATYTSLFCSSLGAWCLILDRAPALTRNQALTMQPKLVAYVEGNQLEMRVSAGEALAFLYELAERSRIARFANHDHLCNILAELASESSKSKTKKDKRMQKMSFRQIHSSIAEGDPPVLTIKLDKENLELDSCTIKLIYDQLTELLRGGMRRQVKSNALLREVFDLGAPVTQIEEKANKQERMAAQNTINKVRDQLRSKQRDKRAC